MDKVKVLLATYNGEKYIIEQIDSIYSQKDVEVKITINDDGSKDTTIAVIKEKFPEIRLKINIPGAGSAANNFLKMVSELDFYEEFDYVSFSDQDDVWLPEKLSAATSKLKQEKADLYCSNLTKWDEKTGELSELKKDFPQKKFDFLFEGGSAGCTYVFTKEFAKELKVFLEKLDSSDWPDFSHDWLVYFFARSRGYKVFIDGNSFINYRIHSNNVHGHLNQLSLKTIKEKASKVTGGYYKKHAENYIKYVNSNSEEHRIYSDFSGSYFQRNKMILKYNTELMRDKKKFFTFMFLNLITFK